MPISFRCCNPDCRQIVKAPDGTEGRKARCPICKTPQTIPGAAEPEPIPLAPPAKPEGVVCGDCGTMLPSKATLCGQCGWVNPAAMGAPPTPAPVFVSREANGAFVGECLKAPAYGLSNLASLTKLVIYSIGLTMAVGMIRGFFEWLIFFGFIGIAIVVLVTLAGNLVISGYFLRFYLDCAISSLEGVNQAPDVPEFDMKELFVTGLQGMGLFCVYLLPIVTIPLLPLALLVWAFSNDRRMFDVGWTLRTALKIPGRLATLWLMLLLWGVVGGLAILGIVMLYLTAGLALVAGSSGFSAFLLLLLLWGVVGFFISVVYHTIMAIQFRCVGMLGRFHQSLLDTLPESTTGAQTAGVLIGAIVCTVVIWGTIFWSL
ncbi:MAG: hypothetical protein JXA11_00895 [Phycisphaerae bacterium]|nr:hypothetical protein [Phycisphaerae bacterium]